MQPTFPPLPDATNSGMLNVLPPGTPLADRPNTPGLYQYDCFVCGRLWENPEPAPPERDLEPSILGATNQDLCGSVKCVATWLVMNPNSVLAAAPWRPQEVIDAAHVMEGLL